MPNKKQIPRVGTKLPQKPMPKQDKGSIFRNFGNVAFTELIVRADFYDFEAFLDEERRELPELFKASVAVENGADVLLRMISGDAKVVVHD